MQKVQAQQGFTLIELVVVIVLLGILGVSALAQFQDLSGDAQNAANAGVAAELTSGSSINYAAESLSPSSGTTTVGLSCDAAATALMVIKPATYTFAAGSGPCGAAGTSMTCPVDDGGTAATAVVLCI
jgi:prepilin-type N-terminal cleavage/methylation domain-containing protein